MNKQPAPPYQSLSALRQANDDLLASLPEDKSDTDAWKSCTTRIFEFIHRAVTTGALLELPFERRAAQGLIDYWVASSYNMPVDGPKELIQSRKINTLLAPFDAVSLRSICERGDQVIGNLSSQDQDLARRVLVQLFQFSDARRNPISMPTPREDLLSLGPPERVTKIITELVNAGVLRERQDNGSDFIDLQYEALGRNWERLHDWVKHRANLRDAALAWRRANKDKSRFLQTSQVKDAMTYGNLDELEKEFVTSSRRRQRRFYLRSALMAAVLVGALPLAYYAYRTLYVPWMFDRDLNTVKADASPPEKRIEALRRLTEYQKIQPKDIDLSSIQLKGDKPDGLDLSGLTASSLILTQATLENVNFQNARLPSSSFIRSAINRSNFESAFLRFARFDNSFIGSSKLSNTDLFRAVFNGAQLCRVNFSEAIVRYASFSDVTFDDDQSPNFENSAWWLAFGWNKHQRELLIKQTANIDPKTMKSFRDELKSVDVPSQGPVKRARVLNEKAWTLATFGVDLNDAEDLVREALKIYGDNGNSVINEREVANTQDTLAYILMQKGKWAEAESLLSGALRATQEDESVLFRYAVTLWMQGNEQQALIQLTKSIARNYSPSHELFVLRNRIPASLESAIEAASSRARGAGAKPPCPAQS
ncbi:MAG: pentapeptide repeat-containing protein [Xanthobacteraceae bacterium]